MKQFFKMFFASLLAMIIAGVIMFGIFMGIVAGVVSKANKENKTKDNTVLVIDLHRHIHELGAQNPFAIFTDDGGSKAGLYKVIKAIEHAKTDNSIKGILIKLESGNNGWATLQQLRNAIEDFKTSKKFVYAYGDDISQNSYFVGSAADSVYLNPVGGIELKGFATVLTFFKGTLDKLELEPEIFYAGKFKSATEPFRYDKMSEPNRIQVSRFQHSFWDQFLQAVAQHTHMDSTAINQLTDSGTIQFPEDALEYKLVDDLLYWDQVEDRIREKTGQKATDKINYETVSDYADNNPSVGSYDDPRIAVIFAEGDIVDGQQRSDYQIASQTIIQTIRKVKNDDKIKAVVLRVNSPGGSALASDEILRELQLLRKKKPLIVSMGDLAASGGYYISCQADSIFALPNTITGSIGVFSMMFNVDKMMKDKLGVTFDGVKTAPYADFPTASRPLTQDESQRMQRSVDHIYGIFKSRVSKGRSLSLSYVDSIAQGHVWSGTDALKIHLIDHFGGFERALQSAATMAKLTKYNVVTYPQPVDKLNMLLKKIKNNASAEAMMKTSLKSELGTDYELYEKVKDLRKTDGKAMMAMPFQMKVQ